MSSELVIYTDESEKDGRYFANFYGGALVRSADLDAVNSELRAVADELGLTAEIKWQKVSSGYLQRYLDMMTAFFRLVIADRVKLRIMFTQKANVVSDLTREQRENEFFLLYYQFLKHAFGLGYCNPEGTPLRLRILLDQLPDTREKAATFKSYIRGLQMSPAFRASGIVIGEDAIAEVRSHDHIVMQCLDVVLGAMQFRLNNGHKIKPEGSERRGSRTIAKEKLYRHINRMICQIYPNFNVGISTGTEGDLTRRWSHSYRHWLFVPENARMDRSRTKRSKAPPSLSR